MVKLTNLVSKEAQKKKSYVSYVFCNIFKNLYKTIKESISSNVPDLFDSKSTWGLKEHSRSTQRAPEHSKDTTGALEVHSKGTWRAL